MKPRADGESSLVRQAADAAAPSLVEGDAGSLAGQFHSAGLGSDPRKCRADAGPNPCRPAVPSRTGARFRTTRQDFRSPFSCEPERQGRELPRSSEGQERPEKFLRLDP